MHHTTVQLCVFMAYLCCLCDLLAAAERWAPDTLPLRHGRGRPEKCVCADSGSSSCVCC